MADTLPGEDEQLLTILRCVSAQSWGRVNLTHILRGEAEAPPGTLNKAAWGALAFRSETALGQMLDRLESAGLLRARRLEHGGKTLELTPMGRSALQDPTVLDKLINPPQMRQSKRTHCHA